jgi:hypothetical protein
MGARQAQRCYDSVLAFVFLTGTRSDVDSNTTLNNPGASDGIFIQPGTPLAPARSRVPPEPPVLRVPEPGRPAAEVDERRQRAGSRRFRQK